jgi:hypothetical protein
MLLLGVYFEGMGRHRAAKSMATTSTTRMRSGASSGRKEEPRLFTVVMPATVLVNNGQLSEG